MPYLTLEGACLHFSLPIWQQNVLPVFFYHVIRLISQIRPNLPHLLYIEPHSLGSGSGNLREVQRSSAALYI